MAPYGWRRLTLLDWAWRSVKSIKSIKSGMRPRPVTWPRAWLNNLTDNGLTRRGQYAPFHVGSSMKTTTIIYWILFLCCPCVISGKSCDCHNQNNTPLAWLNNPMDNGLTRCGQYAPFHVGSSMKTTKIIYWILFLCCPCVITGKSCDCHNQNNMPCI